MQDSIIDVGEGDWKDLSNFTPRPFVFRGLKCASMEGLLQSLKFPLLDKQSRVRSMTGVKAKRIGKKKKWYLDQRLYFLDSAFDRHSSEYINLVIEAFKAMFDQNHEYRERLMQTKGCQLIHSKGASNPRRTILTEVEFVSILSMLRLREPR